MEKSQTHPILIQMILRRLAQWRSNTPYTPVTHILSPTIQAAILEQDSIGWWNFLLGRMSSKFAPIQQSYYESQSSQRGGNTWLWALMCECIFLSFTMWEHRNNIRHNTLTPRAKAELEALQQRVLDECAKGTGTLLPQDHHWIQDKEELLTMDLQDTKTWLLTVTLARRAYRAQVRINRERFRRSQDFMRNWLNNEAWRNRQQPAADP
jgi:hypothetical protein